MAPTGDERTDLPSPLKHGAEAPPTSTMTTPWPENSSANQATMTIAQWLEMPWLDANLHLERWHACQEAAQRRSKLASGQVVVAASPHQPLQHDPPIEERILTMDYAST
jgi:hypothetical protein